MDFNDVQWDHITKINTYDYELICAYYTTYASNTTCAQIKFYCLWMAARAYKFYVGESAYNEYYPHYMIVISEFPGYPEPIFELCQTAPLVVERYELYVKCLKCKNNSNIFVAPTRVLQPLDIPDLDSEILEWKALGGFLVECYNLGKYDSAYDAWVELRKTNILDKVDVVYNEWITHIKKCGEDAENKLRGVSTYAKFREELMNIGNARDKLGKSVDAHFDTHFVWVQGHRTYSIIQYLAVRAARDAIPGSVIYIYNDIEPENNEYWNATKKYAEIVHATPPRYINGRSVPHAQHVADIMRICIIYQFGGIYLDTDLLLIKDLSVIQSFLENRVHSRDVIMCKETNDKIWNGFMMAKPHNTFLNRWLREYETKYGDDTGGCWWAGLSVETPMRLYKENSTDTTILNTHTFLPFGFFDDRIYSEKYVDGGYQHSYGVHLWETEAEKRGVLPKNKEWFNQHAGTIFAELFGKYV